MAVRGAGAVSPAGWGMEAMLAAVGGGRALSPEVLRRAPGAPEVRVRRVPPPSGPPAFAREPRLRRTSAIARFAVAAALEALGSRRDEIASGGLRLGIIMTLLNGCVNFSQRFYGEVLSDPTTASPLIFPETVFNAPSSHLAALLGSGGINYTLVGDTAQFVAALRLAAQWLESGQADGVLVVGAEEFDRLSGEGAVLLDRGLVVAEGAGALYLERSGRPEVALSGPVSHALQPAAAAAERVVAGLRGSAPEGTLWVDGLSGGRRTDAPERAALTPLGRRRVSPLQVLGHGMGAAAAWQCALAWAAVQSHEAPAAAVLSVGHNQQSAGVLFFS